MDDCADYLTRKGFSFAGVDTLNAEKEDYDFKFSKYSSHSQNFISVDKKLYNGTSIAVSVYTVFQSDYLLLKSAIKSLGYKLKSTTTTKEGSLLIRYSKGMSEVTFMITRTSQNDVTDYYITLKDKYASFLTGYDLQ